MAKAKQIDKEPTMKMIATRASLTVVLLALGVGPAVAQRQHPHEGSVRIPESLHHEHEEIQGALRAAMKAPGAVGSAARALERVLMPHFEREEAIALPPLGALRRLVANKEVDDLSGWLVPMTDSLRAELPRMLREHVAIADALRELERAAKSAGNKEVAEFAQALARHAQAEEELFYPMAILVGEIVRNRLR